jgi:hypothetical protein
MSATWDLQKGIYEALAGDATLTGLLGGANIFDRVPHDARFPYVTLGQTADRDWSTGTEEGREHILTFHVFSRAGGAKETQAVIAAIDDALKAAPIALPGHALVNLRFEFSDARRDPDGETLHGIARYRAVTEAMN